MFSDRTEFGNRIFQAISFDAVSTTGSNVGRVKPAQVFNFQFDASIVVEFLLM